MLFRSGDNTRCGCSKFEQDSCGALNEDEWLTDVWEQGPWQGILTSLTLIVEEDNTLTSPPLFDFILVEPGVAALDLKTSAELQIPTPDFLPSERLLSITFIDSTELKGEQSKSESDGLKTKLVMMFSGSVSILMSLYMLTSVIALLRDTKVSLIPE